MLSVLHRSYLLNILDLDSSDRNDYVDFNGLLRDVALLAKIHHVRSDRWGKIVESMMMYLLYNVLPRNIPFHSRFMRALWIVLFCLVFLSYIAYQLYAQKGHNRQSTKDIFHDGCNV